MNVMHVMVGDLWAGAEVQLYETLMNISGEDIANVSVVLFSEGKLARKLSDANINIIVVDEDKHNSISIMSQLTDYLNSDKPDIVHVHDYKSHVITSIAIKKSFVKPAVVRTLHGLKVVPKTLKMFKSYSLSIVENFLLRYRTDCVIAVSENIEKIIIKKYKGVRVEQINNAISIPDKRDEEYKNKVRDEYNVEDSKFWIVAASRLVDIKNLKMLIDAISKIKPVDMDNIIVSVFGDGPLKHELGQQIERLRLGDVITMHGHNNNINDAMPAFDIFVNVSIHEGMPMSVLEVMARNVVPVCTRVGGMKEVIEHSINGMLVELNDVDALADIIVNLKNNAVNRYKIGRAARNQIIKNYNIKNSVIVLNQVYISLLMHQHGRA